MILGKSYLGSTEITKAYLGSNVVYEVVSEVDVFPQDNAAALSDTDATGSFTVSNSSLDVAGLGKTDTTTSPEGGNYCIKSVASATAGSVRIKFPVTLNKTYTIKVWGINTTGTTATINPRVPLGNTLNPITNSWSEHTIVAVATATNPLAEIRFYANFNGVIGDIAYWDKITIIETD